MEADLGGVGGLELAEAESWREQRQELEWAEAKSWREAFDKDGHGPSRLRVNMPFPFVGGRRVLSLGNDCRIVRRVKPFSSCLKLRSDVRRFLQRQG